MRPFTLVAVLALLSQAALAQGKGVYRAPIPRPPATAGSLERLPATGNYLLSYTDEEGNSYVIQVEAADRVVFELGVDVSADSAYATFAYSYKLKNTATGSAGARIGSLILQCDDPDARATSIQWFADVTLVKVIPARKCEFLGSRRVRLSSGATLSDAKITSRWLPGIDRAVVGGEVEPPVWPSGEATPRAASKLARSVNSEYLGGKKADTLAPLKDPASFAVLDHGVGLILADLSRVCSLGWVNNAGVCNSLEVKLKEAQTTVLRNDSLLAGNHLNALQNELSAQRGKHVNELAFLLLSTNVRFIQIHL